MDSWLRPAPRKEYSVSVDSKRQCHDRQMTIMQTGGNMSPARESERVVLVGHVHRPGELFALRLVEHFLNWHRPLLAPT